MSLVMTEAAQGGLWNGMMALALVRAEVGWVSGEAGIMADGITEAEVRAGGSG